jgi:hypothetical protein
MNFPEQTKAMKKSKRKALVFEAGSIPASFRAFGRDGFSPGKIISLDFFDAFFISRKKGMRTPLARRSRKQRDGPAAKTA